MTLWQAGNIVRAYGKANRYWYQHQRDYRAANVADKLQRRCYEVITEVAETSSSDAERLHDLFLREHWSTTFLVPLSS